MFNYICQITVAILVALLVPKSAISQGFADSPDFFQSEVWPILATKCLDCHNDEIAESGLSLSSRAGLLRGGTRGTAINVDGSPLDSPLVSMIQPDTHPRMPFGQPPLSLEEIEVLSIWVASGAVYTDANEGAVKLAYWEQRLSKIKAGVSELAFAPIETPTDVLRQIPFWPVVVGVPLLAGMWWLSGRVRFTPRFMRHPSFLIVCLLIPCGLNLGLLLKYYRATLDPMSSLGMQNQVYMLFGNPPVPVNMHNDSVLWRSYYRGNDERSEKLFNNGNYLTCRFDVGLVDSKGEPVVQGSRLVPGESLYFRYIITRGAHTADVLFDSEMMAGVFLSSESDMHRCRQAADACYLRELEPERVWVAQHPVEVTIVNGSVDRLLYVWQRHHSGQKEYLPKLHYAADLKLDLKDGVVQSSSTLWFNALRVTQPIMNFTIPADQWLSSTPIPELPSANTTDAELLGIVEHRGKTTR